MVVNDEIYGEYDVEEVLEELINSKVFQRLKMIHQGGANYLVKEQWNVTRYEHSIGTMIIVRILGGSVEEQIAALLHDISHTAFSHLVDYVLENKDEDYHEEIYEKIIEESEIPSILKKYNYDYKEILFNEERWTILEKKAPDLCADRIDYTLRDRFRGGDTTKEEIKGFLSSLRYIDYKIVIDKPQWALWFVELYYKEVIEYFRAPLALYASYKLEEALKRALEYKIITIDDFLKWDNYIMELLELSGNETIISILSEIKNPPVLKVNKENYHIYNKMKVRVVNPLVYIDKKFIRIEELSEIASAINKDIMKKSLEGTFIEILR